MPKKYKSPALAALHESMQGLHDIGVINNQTMRRFDESCLTPVEQMTPGEIAEMRSREGVSQNVFAHYLNVSVGSVSKWERGEKHPSGSSLKLLNLVRTKGLAAIA
jgi:putative transcriptional regulator